MSETANPANALLVMAKYPTPGRTKTRLSPPLSPEQAAQLSECFLLDTLDLMRRLAQTQLVIAYSPAGAASYFSRLAPDFELLPQQGPDLGVRLDNALTDYLALGYERVAIMNSDGPTLPLAYLTAAFEGLAGDTEVVLGPAEDGGYYLIGLTRPVPRLLREVQMSTPRVLADTLALAAEEDLRVELLDPWYDVDDGESLARLAAELATTPATVAPHTRTFLEAKEV
jgi:rSAM/selenodomain-associated transferase 1